jgi:hypothetical protein
MIPSSMTVATARSTVNRRIMTLLLFPATAELTAVKAHHLAVATTPSSSADQTRAGTQRRTV